MKVQWAVPIIVSILLIGVLASQDAFAQSTMTIDQGTSVTVESGTTMTIDSDPSDTNTLTNRGTLDVENTGKLIIADEGNWLNDCTGIANLSAGGEVDVGSPGSALSVLTNHGVVNGPGQINFLGTTIDVQNSGILTAILNPLTTIQQIIDPCLAVGGTSIPIDTVSLLMAGGGMNLFWGLPAVVVAGVGIAIFKVRRKK